MSPKTQARPCSEPSSLPIISIISQCHLRSNENDLPIQHHHTTIIAHSTMKEGHTYIYYHIISHITL